MREPCPLGLRYALLGINPSHPQKSQKRLVRFRADGLSFMGFAEGALENFFHFI